MERRNNDNLDQWLDRALRQYGNAEPRAGLESRVVANLALEAKRRDFSNLSRWVLATLSAAALLLFIWLGIGRHGLRRPETTANRPNSGVASDHRVMQSTPRLALEPRLTMPSRHMLDHKIRAVSEANGPRLDKFPSPRPLGRQELLIARFAERFPEDAKLIAQEQRDFEEEIRRAEQELWNSSPISDREK